MLLSIRKVARPNLFWKIFLWFWIATLLVLSSVVFLYSLTGSDGKLVPIERIQLIELRKTAILIQQKRMLDTFQDASILRPKKIKVILDNAYIIDNFGDDFFNRKVPESIYHLRGFNKRTLKPASIIEDNINYYGPEIVYHQGKHFHLYLSKKSKQHFTRVISSLYHSTSFWNILAVLGISSLVCFALAWYLTRPIHQLQKATREFAAGNLTARAQDFIDKRHDEFTDLAIDFDRMADKIDKIILSQKRLLSDVSHELRSPLTRMQIASGLALNKVNPESKAHLERIELEIERLDEMIGELLQVAALERGHFYEEKSKFVINDLLAVLVQDAQFEASANHKAVTFKSDRDYEFFGFYGLLARAAENILRNAIRHTPANSKVNVTLSHQGSEIIIEISDQGSGVNEAHLEKIFEPFYRPTEARERSSGGTGLGLAIAQRGVEANGGTIKAENVSANREGNCGLKVSIKLPFVNEA